MRSNVSVWLCGFRKTLNAASVLVLHACIAAILPDVVHPQVPEFRTCFCIGQILAYSPSPWIESKQKRTIGCTLRKYQSGRPGHSSHRGLWHWGSEGKALLQGDIPPALEPGPVHWGGQRGASGCQFAPSRHLGTATGTFWRCHVPVDPQCLECHL